jgi:recombination protein U
MTNIKSNLGMYAEETINRTATFLSSRNICLIEKRELPIKIIKKVDSTTIVGKLLAKSYIDYFGVYKGKYFEFEVKQTIEEKLKLDIIKQHQFERIKFLSENNIFCFFVVYFSKYEKFYLIPGK